MPQKGKENSTFTCGKQPFFREVQEFSSLFFLLAWKSSMCLYLVALTAKVICQLKVHLTSFFFSEI